MYNFPQKAELPRIAELPDPFIKPDGSRVATPAEWPEQREYLKAMAAHYLYGDMPTDNGVTNAKVLSSESVYDGIALHECIELTAGRNGEVVFQAHVVRPVLNNRVPVIIVCYGERANKPVEDEEEIVAEHGYAIVRFDQEQLAVDNAEALHGQLAQAFPECNWGGMAMWAWGYSRIMDYLLTTDWADGEKVAVTGHSRCGKAALCAGIYDERFAVCAPSAAGCGGTGCFRFVGSRYGEGIGKCQTVGHLEDCWGFWWADAFGEFGARQFDYARSDFPAGSPIQIIIKYPDEAKGALKDEDKIPFDSHTLKALVAPRALITFDALGDTWSNPFGTLVTWRAAQEVFDFLGVPERNAVCFREGIHEFHAAAWRALVNYCDGIFFGKTVDNIVSRYPAKDAPAGNGPFSNAKLAQQMDWKPIKLHCPWSRPE